MHERFFYPQPWFAEEMKAETSRIGKNLQPVQPSDLYQIVGRVYQIYRSISFQHSKVGRKLFG